MELYQIILSVSGVAIMSLLTVIGFFLKNFYKENKETNISILSKIEAVQVSVNSINTKTIVQDEINSQLMEKDNEIWEELKSILQQLHDSTDRLIKIYEAHSKEIHLIDLRLNTIEKEHKLYHRNNK